MERLFVEAKEAAEHAAIKKAVRLSYPEAEPIENPLDIPDDVRGLLFSWKEKYPNPGKIDIVVPMVKTVLGHHWTIFRLPRGVSNSHPRTMPGWSDYTAETVFDELSGVVVIPAGYEGEFKNLLRSAHEAGRSHNVPSDIGGYLEGLVFSESVGWTILIRET